MTTAAHQIRRQKKPSRARLKDSGHRVGVGVELFVSTLFKLVAVSETYVD